jgi:repressor LexA
MSTNFHQNIDPNSIVEITDFMRVPVLGNAYAGKPVPIDALPIEGWREIRPIKGAKPWDKFAAIRVIGDSLIEDNILEGDYLILRLTHEANSGELAVVLTPHGNTIKYLHPHLDGTVLFKGANALFEDQVWEIQDIKVQGVVRRVERDL